MTDEQLKAAALKYEPGIDNAPRIVALGKGRVAEKIIALAQENGLYIHKDPDLVEALSQLDLNVEIPPELYVVVAEILSFVYTLNGGKKIR
jgi:flagellar biosynthesis protein